MSLKVNQNWNESKKKIFINFSKWMCKCKIKENAEILCKNQMEWNEMAGRSALNEIETKMGTVLRYWNLNIDFNFIIDKVDFCLKIGRPCSFRMNFDRLLVLFIKICRNINETYFLMMMINETWINNSDFCKKYSQRRILKNLKVFFRWIPVSPKHIKHIS